MTVLKTSETRIPRAGWHHIEVTRSLGDWFSVYHNGSLIIQVQDTGTSIDTSEMFVFSPQKGVMFDNIVVDNEIPEDPIITTTTTTTSPTTTPPPFDPILIGLIGGIGIGVVIILAIVYRRRG
ncbi:MAG: hypothetical protein ACFFCX_10835 [Candidatus Sifarchaeia archaeon]